MKKNVQKAQKHTHSELDKIANDLLKSFYHSAVPYAGFAPITEVKLLEQTQADNIIGQLCNAGFVEKTTYIEASGNTRRFTLPVSKERIAEIFGESFGKVVQFAYIDAFFYAVGLTGRERLRLIPTVCMNPMEAEQISAALSMLLGDGSADQEDPYIQASLLNYLLASILLSKALPFEPEAIDHKYDIEHIGKAWAARLPEIVSTLTEKSLCDMAFDVRLAEWPEEEETIKYYNTGELGKTMSADSMRDQYNLAERKRNKASPIRRLLRLNSDSSDYDSQVLEVSGILASGVGVGLIRVRRDDPELYAPSATAGEMAYAADWELRPLFQRFYEEHVGTFLVNYWRKRGKLYRNFAKKVNQSNDPAGKLFKERVKEALECSGEKFKKHNVQMIDIKMATLLGTTGFVSLSEVQPEAVPAITIGTAEVAGVGK
ncbi:MAG: hypothetical protein FWH06_00405 [Oscillospiraceae bacterium]|nr:hypothetical protein [Oscillospiraceae bacterium]